MEHSSKARRSEIPGNPRIPDSRYRRERKGNVDAMVLIGVHPQVEAPPNGKPFPAQVLTVFGGVSRLRRRPISRSQRRSSALAVFIGVGESAPL